ncbi:hypothetical protein HZH68_001342 [Vespula germanica]|uniref:Uncharacterized protein n=1 Tax=Vespula germanica TaxID=30212 RepID=A0A834NVX1_VESGE|nr:hypothetical protein HZH68_001342 [Vespula germanica]
MFKLFTSNSNENLFQLTIKQRKEKKRKETRNVQDLVSLSFISFYLFDCLKAISENESFQVLVDGINAIKCRNVTSTSCSLGPTTCWDSPG